MKKKKPKKAPLKKTTMYATLLLLIISLSYIFYLENKIKKINKETKARLAYPNFLTRNHQLTCKNPNIDVNTLPLCPKGKGIKILPKYYPTQAIIIGYEIQANSIDFINTIMNSASTQSPIIPMIVLTPQNQYKQAINELESFIPSHYEEYIKFVATPSEYTVWAQDYFEFGTRINSAQPVIFDLPYEKRTGEHVPSALALTCGYDLVSQTNTDANKIHNPAKNFGGNIESISDNVVLIGKNMSAQQKKSLKLDLNQNIVEIDVDWLKVGHVDEVISTIPKVPAPGQCPFDVLYASPGKTLELFQAESTKKNEPIVLFYETASSKITLNLWDCYKSNHENPGCKSIQVVNKTYEKIMKKNIQLINKALLKHDKCQTNFVPVPVWFTAPGSINKFGQSTDQAQSIDPNPVNNILLGKHIIVPRQRIDILQNYTTEIFRNYDVDVKFVDGDYVHRFGGGVHCASNVRRTCRPHKP